MTPKVSITCAVVLVVLGVSLVQAQQTYPPFTMVMQKLITTRKGTLYPVAHGPAITQPTATGAP
jgi:hypothetical protein